MIARFCAERRVRGSLTANQRFASGLLAGRRQKATNHIICIVCMPVHALHLQARQTKEREAARTAQLYNNNNNNNHNFRIFCVLFSSFPPLWIYYQRLFIMHTISSITLWFTQRCLVRLCVCTCDLTLPVKTHLKSF